MNILDGGDGLDVIVETVGAFDENSYFLVDHDSKETVAIDPGDEGSRLLEIVAGHDLTVRCILNTHGHIDHVCAVAAMKRATGAPFHIHPKDRFFLAGLPAQAAFFGLPAPQVPEVDGSLAEGQIFHLGPRSIPIRVIETPGHSPGSVTLEAMGSLFVGDALFQGSIGRTDLPGGDYDVLLRSIRERLLSYPDSTKVFPGHGPPTTIGQERRTNPFLK